MRLKPLQPQYITCVSIHASVKDATLPFIISEQIGFVSIHASVKDATEKHEGALGSPRVSIHASVKDATSETFSTKALQEFQSTHL